jgi:xanthine dehydrogenase accessory factor
MSLIEATGDKAESKTIADAISHALQQNSGGVLATLVAAPADAQANVGAKLFVREGLTTSAVVGSLGSAELDRAVRAQAARFLESRVDTSVFQVNEFAPELVDAGEVKILFELIQAEPRLLICGAGHVGASLAKLASLLGYRTTLIDDRGEFVTREHFPEENIELIAAENLAEAVAAAIGNGRGVSVAIVTRGHSEDEQCLRIVIGIDVDYIGLIGSKRRTNIVLQRLKDNGADVERIGRVRAPVGLDIGAVTPEEVALAIMAEIVAVRRGGKGGSLSAWRRG